VTFVTLMMLMSVGSAMATEVDTHWDGSGTFSENVFYADGVESHFSTSGNDLEGEFHATSVDDKSRTNASVGDGGEISFDVYGRDGDDTHSYVASSDDASMTFTTEMTYGWAGWLANKDGEFSASGSSYEIGHSIEQEEYTDDEAFVHVEGSGNATVTIGNEGSQPGGRFSFAGGDSGVEAEGSGSTFIQGTGTCRLKGNDWEMPSGGTYTETWNYDGGATISDIWMQGN